jgi:L-alanine-DL-glutamate epimerase-like enolase superfamily enzyme
MQGPKSFLNEVLVKIHTDEGFVGVADSGACYPDGVQDATMLLMKVWEPMLIGADPFDIELIMAKLSRYLYNDMFQIPPAVTVVDFAMWDLLGKIQNKPVYQLLGGKANEKLMFNFFITGQLSPTPAGKAKEAEKVVAAGVKSLSLKAGPTWGNPDMKADVANVRAVRKAIGDDVELCVDTNGGYDYTSALELGRRLQEFNLTKYEQPVPYWDVAGLANLRKKLNIPICAHESSTTLPGLLEVIKKDAADMVGLKVCWVGGITQAIKWVTSPPLLIWGCIAAATTGSLRLRPRPTGLPQMPLMASWLTLTSVLAPATTPLTLLTSPAQMILSRSP